MNCLNTAKSYGDIEFNEDNKENIKWNVIAGIVYIGCTCMILYTSSFFEPIVEKTRLLMAAFVCFAFAVGEFYCAFQLYQVSKRPYWQIYKYYLTGQREKKEKIVIIIGTILAGYMKFMWKLSIWSIKFMFRIAMGY